MLVENMLLQQITHIKKCQIPYNKSILVKIVERNNFLIPFIFKCTYFYVTWDSKGITQFLKIKISKDIFENYSWNTLPNYINSLLSNLWKYIQNKIYLFLKEKAYWYYCVLINIKISECYIFNAYETQT